MTQVQQHIDSWSRMYGRITDLRNDVHSLINDCIKDDFDDVETYHDELEDRFDSSIFETGTDEWKKFNNDMDNLRDDLKEKWEQVKNQWANDFSEYWYSPKYLHNAAETWRVDITDKMGETEQDIAQTGSSGSWMGKGAEAYRKQIPIQTKAISDVKKLVMDASTGLENGSQGMKALYLTIAQTFTDMKSQLEGLPKPANTMFGTRMSAALSLCTQAKDYFDDLKEGFVVWGETIADTNNELKEAIRNSDTFKGGESWPAATVEGEMTPAVPPPGGAQPGTEPPPTEPEPDYPDPSDNQPDTPNESGVSQNPSPGSEGINSEDSEYTDYDE